MEGELIGTIIASVTSLASGIYGGVKLGKNQQLESVKSLIQDYVNANEFNKGELEDVKISLKETRTMHKECEDGRKELSCQIDELRDKTAKMETIIQKHIRAK
jgi:chromosome segregation ATPase